MLNDDTHDRLIDYLREELEVAQTGFDSAETPQFHINKALVQMVADIRHIITPVEEELSSAERALTHDLQIAKTTLFRAEFPHANDHVVKNERPRPTPRTRSEIRQMRIARARQRAKARRQQRTQQAEHDNGLG